MRPLGGGLFGNVLTLWSGGDVGLSVGPRQAREMIMIIIMITSISNNDSYD